MNHATNIKGEPMVVLTRGEYDALLEQIENAGDAALINAAKQSDAGAPQIPSDLLEAMLDGSMHPLTAWRKAAGLTQGELSQKSGIRAATISDIESSKIDPRLSTIKAIADALGVDIDDLVV